MALLEGPARDAGSMAEVRTAALALAAVEAQGTEDGAGQVAALCRDIAAGVTALQDRAEGLAPPGEALMLLRL
ncbi:hypothetical protein ACWGKQ_12815 [Streptomyces sp. NPDC054770]